MTAMSRLESVFCRSVPWSAFARRVVLPWAVQGSSVAGDVLELGAGSGAMSQRILEGGAGVRLTAIDIDPSMVDRIENALAPYGASAVAGVGDATRLPFRDASFDVVVSWLMLHHTIDWETAITEAARVLRPGGRLVGYDLVDTRTARLIHRLDGSEHRLFSPSALESALESALDAATVAPAIRGLVCRFSATARGSVRNGSA